MYFGWSLLQTNYNPAYEDRRMSKYEPQGPLTTAIIIQQ